MLLRTLLLCALVAVARATSDDNDVEEELVDRTTTLSTIQLPGQLSVPDNLVSGLATAGAVVLGVLGVAAVLALLLPLFGIKLCYLTGTCDPFGGTAAPFAPSQPLPPATPHAYDAYNAQNAYAAAAGTGPAYTSSNSYQRRSLEYVGPILRMLSNAYDRYAVPRLVGKGHRSVTGIDLALAPANRPSTGPTSPPDAPAPAASEAKADRRR